MTYLKLDSQVITITYIRFTKKFIGKNLLNYISTFLNSVNKLLYIIFQRENSERYFKGFKLENKEISELIS